MEIKILYSLLPLLPLLCACQTEAIQEDIIPKRVLRVKATLPGTDATRTHITYGNTDVNKELFRWDNVDITGSKQNDCIAVYNISKFSQNPPSGVQLDVVEINGRSATFESVESVNSSFKIEKGDTIFVNYWETGARQIDSAGNFDPRKIFTIVVGTESNKPQVIDNDPTAESYMSYMQGDLKMYDIVTAVEDDKIPDLHFKYLSAILRITLKNETGQALYPTKLEFKYPGTQSFFKTTLYCSVDPDSPGGLKIYTDDDLFKGSEPYTDEIGTTVNAKDDTTDVGESIPSGKTYDLYLSTVPRIENKQTGNSLTINLIANHDTDHPYSITLDGFDKPIEAGKRYWFNLTAVKEVVEDSTINKLMLTSEWPDSNPEQTSK